MNQAVEVVIFRPLIGVSQNALESAARNVNAVLHSLPGFLSREFAVSEDGQCIDIVHWEDMDCAKQAAQSVMNIPACLEFFKLIDQNQVSMMHFYRKF